MYADFKTVTIDTLEMIMTDTRVHDRITKIICGARYRSVNR